MNWYEDAARRLPWRGVSDPYAVWVSEVMLQQTRVETVIPFYERWMRRFPTVQSLAEASEQDVLLAWEGMGYYNRARSLHKAARQVMRDYGGKLPASREALIKLPGIGEYSAGAIASIAFGLDETAVDGNIRRVYARLFDVDTPIKSPEGLERVEQIAREQLPAGRAGDYNQALMDLGAMICLPREPRCEICPLKELCLARQNDTQAERPVKSAKPEIPHWTVTAAVIWKDGKVLLARRPLNGLLGGMWEFPGGKLEAGESLKDCLKREIVEELDALIEVGEAFGVYEHAYTHFKVTLHAFTCRFASEEPDVDGAEFVVWAAPEDLQNYPMGKIDRDIARRIVSERGAAR